MSTLLSTAKVAEQFGVNQPVVQKWIRNWQQGKGRIRLRATKPGHDWVVDEQDLSMVDRAQIGKRGRVKDE